MRTGFSDDRRADPRIAEADAILRACVHCGFCAPACPTYAVTGDELDAPRGRIWLIRDMLESDGPPPAEAVAHLDGCLECLNCMPACPSGVDYRRLIAIAHAEIEETGRRPASVRVLRALLVSGLTSPRRAARLFRLARPVRALAPLLPRRWRAALGLAAAAAPTDGPGPAPGVHPAEGARKGRVGIVAGCVQSVIAPGINAALIRMLGRHGIESVVLADAACCGAIDHHMGRLEAARAHARAVIAAVERARDDGGLDAVIQTAAGCGTLMKDYGHLLRDDVAWAARARDVAALVRDASEYLDGLAPAFTHVLPPFKVAWQAPCSLTNGQRVTAEPVALLRRAGFAVVMPDDGGYCCGSAGTYNALVPEMAETLGARKATALGTLHADVVVSANIGCMTQLRPRLGVPLVHLVELMDWATGGPVPAALVGHGLDH